MNRLGVSTKTRGIHTASLIAALACLVAAASGCSLPGGPPRGMAEAQLQVRAVKTELASKRSIGSPAEQVADAISGTAVDIVPKAGGTVIQLVKNRGESVQKGDVLLRLDNTDAESARRKNELSVRTTAEALKKAKDDQTNNSKDLNDSVIKVKTALKNAEQDYNKLRNEYDDGKATDHQVEQAKQQVDSARMNLESAQNKLAINDNSNMIASYESQAESARLALEDSLRTLENYNVTAPISGVLTDFTPVVGQTLTSGKIGQIQQVDPIKLRTELSESNYLLVKNKQELVFYNPNNPDLKKSARISYLSPIMSAQTKTFSLELEVPNSDLSIQAGNRYMVQLTTEEEEKVLTVPTLSIIREESDAYVFVQLGDSYQKRKIKLGRVNGTYQEVLSGIKEGDPVVVFGQHQLKDGQKVDSTQNGQQGSAVPEPKAKL